MHACRPLTFAALIILSCLAAPAAPGQSGGVIHRVSVPAPALRRNMVHDKPRDRVSVYLPPSYAAQPSRRYPVLYFLHGFDADDRALIQGHYQNLNIRVSMDSL